jgi:hypothetical protein
LRILIHFKFVSPVKRSFGAAAAAAAPLSRITCNHSYLDISPSSYFCSLKSLSVVGSKKFPYWTGGALLITPYVRFQTDRKSAKPLSSNAFQAKNWFYLEKVHRFLRADGGRVPTQ